MGFGLLFVGYIFLIYSISFADLFGYLVMIAAARKLSQYIDGFRKVSRVLYALAAVALLDSMAALGALAFSGTETVLKIAETTESVAAILSILLSLLFYVFMLRAIADIAREVELFRVEKWARINLVCSVIAAASGFLNFIAVPGDEKAALAVVFGAVPIALNIVIVILNGVLIYTCYMRICLPSEQDITLPPKETKKRTASLFHRPLDEDEAEVERLFEEKQAEARRLGA